MTVNDAVAKRISDILKSKNITQYRLEQNSGIDHGSMQCIMNGRNKTVTLTTLIKIARGLNMTLSEFLDDDISIIIITQIMANEIRNHINRKIGSSVLPMIIEIPDKDGSSGGSSDQINEFIKRVIGVEMVK